MLKPFEYILQVPIAGRFIYNRYNTVGKFSTKPLTVTSTYPENLDSWIPMPYSGFKRKIVSSFHKNLKGLAINQPFALVRPTRSPNLNSVDQEGVEPSSGNKAINNLYRFGADRFSHDLSDRFSRIQSPFMIGTKLWLISYSTIRLWTGNFCFRV